MLLIAWAIHLKADGFFGGPAQEHALKASDLVHALLWASAVLGLASIALYHWAGIGSRQLR